MAVYQNTTLGLSLTDALDDLAQETTLSMPVLKTIVSQFEKSMSAALDQVPHTADLRGSARTFQMVNDVWKLSSPTLRGRVGGADVNATNTVVVLAVNK